MKSNSLIKFLPILTFVLVGVIFYISTIYTPKWDYDWSGIRSELKDSILKLDEYGSITNNGVGYSGKTPSQWHRQNWILENATESELSKLTDYPSGIVKGIAYEGLLINHDLNQYKLLKKSLNDSLTFVRYQYGCIGSICMISEYNIKHVLRLDDSIYDKSSNLTVNQKNEILSNFELMKEKERYYIEEFRKTIKY